MNAPENIETYEHGDVFQINEIHGRKGWIGAFVMATEIRHWGIQGYVPHIASHEEQQQAYIRLIWEEIDHIGKATLVPRPANEGEEG